MARSARSLVTSRTLMIELAGTTPMCPVILRIPADDVRGRAGCFLDGGDRPWLADFGFFPSEKRLWSATAPDRPGQRRDGSLWMWSYVHWHKRLLGASEVARSVAWLGVTWHDAVVDAFAWPECTREGSIVRASFEGGGLPASKEIAQLNSQGRHAEATALQGRFDLEFEQFRMKHQPGARPKAGPYDEVQCNIDVPVAELHFTRGSVPDDILAFIETSGS